MGTDNVNMAVEDWVVSYCRLLLRSHRILMRDTVSYKHVTLVHVIDLQAH